MSVNLAQMAGAGWQFFDNNGIPLAGGLLYTYAAGTTTPQATYTSISGVTAQTNPIVLDAAGRVPEEIWYTEGLLYKFVLKDSNNVQIGSYDNLGASYVSSDLANDLANNTDPTKGDALIGFRQSNISGNLTNSVGRTVHQKFQEYVSVKDFGAIGDGIIDDTIALQNAFNFATDNTQSLFFPAGTYSITSTIVINQNNYWNFFNGNGVAEIVWNGADTEVDMFTIYNALFTHFIGIRFKAKTLQTIVNIKGDIVNNPRPDGAGAAGATFISCSFTYGKFQLRWTTIDRDYNNEQGKIEQCTFLHYYFAAISIEHANSLWHCIVNCAFSGDTDSTWVLNTVDDQGGNSFSNPTTYKIGFGGSGITIENCNLTKGGWLRLSQMLYAIRVKYCFGEGSTNFVYTPTNRLPFTGTTTSNSNQVTNVTNINQLVVGDYFWNASFNAKVTITNINVSSNTITISDNAYYSESNSICDAGIPTSYAEGRFLLYLENYSGTLWASNSIQNQLILYNSALKTGGNYNFVFSMLNCNISTANSSSPVYIGPLGVLSKDGYITFDNNTGESMFYSIINGTAQIKGINPSVPYDSSTFLILSSETLLDVSSSYQTSTYGYYTYIANNVLYSGQIQNQDNPNFKFSRINPTGVTRYIKVASAVNVNTIANLVVGATLTFYFLDGNITLINGTYLILKDGVNVTPSAGNKIVFYSDGVYVREIERNF